MLFAALSEHAYIGICLLILMILSLCFFARASFYVFLLKKIDKQLGGLSSNTHGSTFITPSEYQEIFSVDAHLSHLWSEYQKTLHTQSTDDVNGSRSATIRATVPAELFFSTQAVVDHRVGTEFFKHFPGIFTGIGIIGTFTSLITGLQHFTLSNNTDVVRHSLENLMHLVSSAFTISAFAITLAMIVTFIEKFLMSSLYKRTENIAQRVDQNFISGVGEEYLSRLVQASDKSSFQFDIFKDQLISELGSTLRELKDTQRESLNTGNQAIEASINKNVQDALHPTLQHIANTLQFMSKYQRADTNNNESLQKVMTDFIYKLDNVFSRQLNSLNELNQKTVDSIEQVVVTLKSLEQIDTRISHMMDGTYESESNIFQSDTPIHSRTQNNDV
ncbi:hypothetical protein LMG33818_002214 [Halomonadaceae bacterium LMG 33818]